MVFEKIEEKLHIRSKTGQAVFESLMTGAVMFALIFGISTSLKIAPTSTILGGSAFAAVFGIFFAFLKKFMK